MTMVRTMVRDRVDNTRRTVRRQVGIFRDVVEDVVERFDADQQTEPPNARGGIPFSTRGTLLKEPLMIAGATLDNGVQHVQEMARINRRIVRR